MSNDDFMLDDVCHRAVEKEAMAHRYSPDLYRRSTDEQSSKSHQPRDPQCRPVPTNMYVLISSWAPISVLFISYCDIVCYLLSENVVLTDGIVSCCLLSQQTSSEHCT